MFITFEGSEGSGKSTQIVFLADRLLQLGYQVVKTREPGGTPIGDQIRNVLLSLKNTAMHPRTEALLLQAARAQHVEEIIRPGLEQGAVVLCDRYADSTLAYQGYGHQQSIESLQPMIEYATGGLRPDLTLLFDLDVEIGLQRRAHGGEWNRLDALNLAFYQRVRQGYLHMAHAEPARWVVINAEQTLTEVQTAVWHAVQSRLPAAH